MLRTIFVFLIIGGFLPFALTSPFAALLFYLWISYFRPEDWVWSGAVSALNLQFVVGLWLVLFTLLSGQRFRFGVGPLLLLLFLCQGLLSTTMSLTPVYAWQIWPQFAKVLLVGYLMIVLVTTEQRLRLTLAVIVLSLGFEGAKQGWAQFLLNPGAPNENHWAMLGDNNGVAVGMLMLLSLLTGLIRTSAYATQRHLGRFLAIGVAYRALSTYSRGGFLAFGALILHFVLYSRRKLASLALVVTLAAIVFPVLPEAFWDRMSTIQTAVETEGQVDTSSSGRLHFWNVAVAMANDRPMVGIGHDAFNLVYDRYDSSNGEYGRGRSVHSLWFGLLAEMGYPGLLLFLILLGRSFMVCRRTRRLAKASPRWANLAVYATTIEGALVVAVVGGTFVPFQYNEMLWHVIALTMVVEQLGRQAAAQPHDVAATEGVPTEVPPVQRRLA